MSNNNSNVISLTPLPELPPVKYYCRFRRCKAGPMTPAALYYHYKKHYPDDLARQLTDATIKEQYDQEYGQ